VCNSGKRKGYIKKYLSLLIHKKWSGVVREFSYEGFTQGQVDPQQYGHYARMF
jgi:hypothetical protein